MRKAIWPALVAVFWSSVLACTIPWVVHGIMVYDGDISKVVRNVYLHVNENGKKIYVFPDVVIPAMCAGITLGVLSAGRHVVATTGMVCCVAITCVLSLQIVYEVTEVVPPGMRVDGMWRRDLVWNVVVSIIIIGSFVMGYRSARTKMQESKL